MLHVPSTQAVTVFAPDIAPVAWADPGEAFVLETQDCYGGQIDGPHVLRPHVDMSRFNRATGPVGIRDVRAGDPVGVEVVDIELADAGVMVTAPGIGMLGDRVTTPTTRIVPVRDGRAWVTAAAWAPLRPMVGVLGCATATDVVPTSTPGPHGGNLDTRLLTAGATLVLRASRDGLAVAAGDLHAAMGDGELGGTGVEIAGRVTLRVVPLQLDLAGAPAIIDARGHLHVLASARAYEDAVREAFATVVDLVARARRLDWADAYRLASITCDAGTSQLVNPLVTARVRVPAHVWRA